MLIKNRKVLALGGLWAALTLFFIFMLLLLDISRHKDQLQLESSVIYEYAYERALINEILLNNFVALVENDKTDLDAVRNYAAKMREHYPHISYFLLYQRVTSESVSRFEEEMQKQGNENFSIRLQKRGQAGIEVNSADQSFFYPVVFVEPLNPDSRRLLGLDGYSIAANRVAMMKASYYLDVFAAKAYPMKSGEMGYRLFNTIDPSLYGDSEEGHLIASLVVKANTLLPPRPHVNDQLNIVLSDGTGNQLAVRHENQIASWMSEKLLPKIQQQKSIERFGQTLEVTVTRQLIWSEVSWLTSFLVTAFSIAAFALIYQNYSRRKDAQAELEQLNDKLIYERDQLEERVQERTWELVKANSDLRVQMKENRSLTEKILTIQEEERRNLARELHDEMGQSLTAIRTDAQLVKNSNTDDKNSLAYQAAESIDTIAQRIYSVTYGLMRALRPAALDDLGLTDALNECIANAHLRTAGIEIKQEFKGAINELPERLNISCYRLLQEALNNCVKHSQASSVELKVIRESSPDRLQFFVQDNGCGFDTDAESDGFGIIGMRERVYGLGGSFTITSEPGKGTLVQATIPVMQRSSD